MQIELIRHATLLVDYAGVRLLVDPMLSDAGAMAPIQNSPQPRKNPLVPLPRPAKKILEDVQAVLVTHTHRDHWDDAAAQLLPKDLQIFCQPEDLEKMQTAGFQHATAVSDSIHLLAGGAYDRGIDEVADFPAATVARCPPPSRCRAARGRGASLSRPNRGLGPVGHDASEGGLFHRVQAAREEVILRLHPHQPFGLR